MTACYKFSHSSSARSASAHLCRWSRLQLLPERSQQPSLWNSHAQRHASPLPARPLATLCTKPQRWWWWWGAGGWGGLNRPPHRRHHHHHHPSHMKMSASVWQHCSAASPRSAAIHKYTRGPQRATLFPPTPLVPADTGEALRPLCPTRRAGFTVDGTEHIWSLQIDGRHIHIFFFCLFVWFLFLSPV